MRRSPWHRPSTMARPAASAAPAAGCRRPARIRAQAQCVDRAPHRQQRGLQDVQLIDLLDARLRNAQRKRFARIASNQRVALVRHSAPWNRPGPSTGLRSSRITAAATTGPASGPRARLVDTARKPACGPPARKDRGLRARGGVHFRASPHRCSGQRGRITPKFPVHSAEALLQPLRRAPSRSSKWTASARAAGVACSCSSSGTKARRPGCSAARPKERSPCAA